MIHWTRPDRYTHKGETRDGIYLISRMGDTWVAHYRTRTVPASRNDFQIVTIGGPRTIRNAKEACEHHAR